MNAQFYAQNERIPRTCEHVCLCGLQVALAPFVGGTIEYRPTKKNQPGPIAIRSFSVEVIGSPQTT